MCTYNCLDYTHPIPKVLIILYCFTDNILHIINTLCAYNYLATYADTFFINTISNCNNK